MAVWGERPDVIAPIGPEYPTASWQAGSISDSAASIRRNLRNWGLYEKEEDGTRHFSSVKEDPQLAYDFRSEHR